MAASSLLRKYSADAVWLQDSQHSKPSDANGIKGEDVQQAAEDAAEDNQAGRGQKRKRKGKDKHPTQPVKSYTTRERAKAEAEVVAEVSSFSSIFRSGLHSLCSDSHC